MKFRMAENSLFAILLRKPWWASAATAAGVLAFARFLLPPAWFVYAAPMALPFVVIAAVVGWRTLRAPSASRVADTQAAVRAMSATQFAAALEDAWRRDGWTVERLAEPGADFEATRERRRTVVACRRWKAARTGIEPLRELDAARERRDAHDAAYVALGEPSEQAARFAAAHRIRIVGAPELAAMLRGTVRRGAAGALERQST